MERVPPAGGTGETCSGGQTRRSVEPQRLATYIVISKPKRRSVAFGVSQLMVIS